MNIKSPFDFVSKNIVRAIYIHCGACLIAGIVLSIVMFPVEATTNDSQNNLLDAPEPTPACTPPPDWNQTVRVVNPRNPSKQWTFDIDEPLMDVTLVFFYYQDYDKTGCPFDCSTGECQTDEGGKGSSPLGAFFVLDGKEGANRGIKKLEGRLAKGKYHVTFTATGNPGSINVGLNVHKDPVPTPTLEPTNTPTPTATNTPTATGTQTTDTPTATVTGTIPPPSDTPTPTKTEESPTPTATGVTRTPPATLPPPTPFPGTPTPQILIPVTGVELEQIIGINGWALIPFSLGVLGLGIAFFGIIIRLKRN